MRRVVLIIAASLAIVAAPAWAQSKAAIQQLNDRWMAAFNSGDAAAVATMYTGDAYVLPAGGPLVQGRPEIEIFFRKTLTQLGDASLTTLHVLPLGSRAAREIGTFRFKTKATPPQEISGKYVVVWRRIAGQWKLATDIWNANE